MRKYTILELPEAEYHKRILREIALCAVIVVIVCIGNLLLLLNVTEQNRLLFLMINGLSDTLAGWFLFGFSSLRIRPQLRKERLLRSAQISGTVVQGRFLSFGEQERAGSFDCRKANLETEQGVRVVYVMDGTFSEQLRKDASLRLTLENNIAVACEVLE